MKKYKIMVFALIGMMTRFVACKANDKIIMAKQLPMSVKLFVQQNFPHLSIAYAEKRGKGQSAGYDVSLNDGTELYFSVNGKWDMVDCKSEALPSSLIPDSVYNIIDRRFTDAQFVKINKTRNGYEITLSNGVIMKLDMNGQMA